MMSAAKNYGTRATARGFSLIEAVVVLGVVALVIGGIWAAATRVRQSSTVADAATLLTHMVAGIQGLYKPDIYPTTYGSETFVTGTVFQAGLAKGTSITSDNFTILGPSNLNVRVVLACWSNTNPSDNCPQLGIKIMPGISASACTELVRKMLNNRNLVYAQIQTTANSSYQIIYPNSGITPNCPADYSTIIFWFRPYP